jgi:hypothetical protein
MFVGKDPCVKEKLKNCCFCDKCVPKPGKCDSKTNLKKYSYKPKKEECVTFGDLNELINGVDCLLNRLISSDCYNVSTKLTLVSLKKKLQRAEEKYSKGVQRAERTCEPPKKPKAKVKSKRYATKSDSCLERSVYNNIDDYITAADSEDLIVEYLKRTNRKFRKNRCSTIRESCSEISATITEESCGEEYVRPRQRKSASTLPDRVCVRVTDCSTDLICLRAGAKFKSFIQKDICEIKSLRELPGIGDTYAIRLRPHFQNVQCIFDFAAQMQRGQFRCEMKRLANMNRYNSDRLYLSIHEHIRTHQNC